MQNEDTCEDLIRISATQRLRLCINNFMHLVPTNQETHGHATRLMKNNMAMQHPNPRIISAES